MNFTKDTRVWEKLKKDLLAMNNTVIKTGWFDTRYGPENDNIPVAQVAQFNEEGSSTNPPRPFIRFGFIPAIKRSSLFKNLIENLLSGKGKVALQYAGKQSVLLMQKEIKDWSTPPNSQRTIERKGFNDPLRDTDTMLNSVDYKIEKK